jgi:ABC-type multidrug transport system permease subunit
MSAGLGMAFNNDQDHEYKKIAIVIPENAEKDSIWTNLFLDTELIQGEDYTTHSKTISNYSNGFTTYNFINTDMDNAIVLLKRGIISLILTQKDGKIDYLFDAHNSEAKLLYLEISAIANNSSLVSKNQIIEPLTKIGTRYIDFLIPGLIAMGIMSSVLWGISYGLIEKRSKKLLRRMVATPMRKSYFLLAQIISRLVLTLFDTLFLILFAHFVFDMQIQGSIFALILIILSGNFAFMGIAILIASRTSNTQVGNGFISAITMPMMLLSGIFFSYQNFPEWAIPAIQTLPLTTLTDGIRSIFIEGAGILTVLPSILILTGIGTISFIVGLKIFKWY